MRLGDKVVCTAYTYPTIKFGEIVYIDEIRPRTVVIEKTDHTKIAIFKDEFFKNFTDLGTSLPPTPELKVGDFVEIIDGSPVCIGEKFGTVLEIVGESYYTWEFKNSESSKSNWLCPKDQEGIVFKSVSFTTKIAPSAEAYELGAPETLPIDLDWEDYPSWSIDFFDKLAKGES